MREFKKFNSLLALIIFFSFCSFGEYSREKCIEENQEFYDAYELTLLNKSVYEDSISEFTSSEEFKQFRAKAVLGFDEAFPINSYDSNINNYSSTISVLKFVREYRYDIEFLVFSPNRHIYHLLKDERNDNRSEHFIKFKDSEKVYSFYVGSNEQAIANLNDGIELIITNRFNEYFFLTSGNKFLITNEEIFYEEFPTEIDEIKLLGNNKNSEGNNLNEIFRNFYKSSYESLSEWKYFFTEHPECLNVPEIKYQLSESVLIDNALDILYKNTIEEMDSKTYKTSD